MDTFGFIFAFQVLPTIIFFSALTSVLFYLGIIQKVVKVMAWALSKVLKISGAESLSVAGNIFLGQTEAPLLIKAYLEKMNKSEMLLVMIGGMATVAGAVLAAYIGFLGGDDPVLRLKFAKHLLAASVMAAPGAIVISKILYPQTEAVNTDVKVSSEKIGSNILDAIANGTTDGLKLAVNVGAMLLVFVAFIAMINGILGWIGDITTVNDFMAANTPYAKLSLEAILGTVFAPLMWLIGIAKEDVMMMGQLLGIKLAASEFVGYIQLADLKNASQYYSFNIQQVYYYGYVYVMRICKFCIYRYSNWRNWIFSTWTTKNIIRVWNESFNWRNNSFINFSYNSRNDYWIVANRYRYIHYLFQLITF